MQQWMDYFIVPYPLFITRYYFFFKKILPVGVFTG